MDNENNGQYGETPPPPPPAPAAEEAFRERLERAEEWIAALHKQLTDAAAGERERAAKAVSKDELKLAELKISDVAASVDGLQRTFAREGELAARLEGVEGGLAELRTLLAGQQSRLKKEFDAMAPKDELGALRVSIFGALNAMEEMKKTFSQYAEEFSGVERECRKALGEAQGYAKAAAQGPAAPQFNEYLKDAVARLSAKLGEVETALHAGMAEVGGKMTANEVLYKKMFAAAEENLVKSVEPRLKDLDGQLRWLRENLLRVSDDFTVVTERKIRALEAKASAFDSIARRMDAIDAALKKGGRIGLP